jgi:DNA replication factor GINS
MYDELYEIWKREKENENEVQYLPKNFYSKIVEYIKKLKEENRMLDKKTTKAKLLDNEFKKVKIMIAELFSLRYNKLRKNAFTRKLLVKDALTEEERKMYNEVLQLVEAYQTFSKDILRGRLSSLKKDQKQNVMILRFIQEIPALVGADMKTYGPFCQEDIASLPSANAQILIKQGIAINVDVN